MVNKAFVNVGRWSALAFGLVYGYSHNASLQKQEDLKKQQLEYHHKELLIEEARRAYAKKSTPVVATTDAATSLAESVNVESPDFDLEKFLKQFEESK